MSPPLPPLELAAQVQHPPVPDNISNSQLGLDSLLNSLSPSNAGASTPAEQGVCGSTAWLSPECSQACTPDGRQQQVQAQPPAHNSAERQWRSGKALTPATPTPPIFSPIPAGAATFTDLPDHLQTIIFSYSAAPFTTCKNSAAVRQDAALLADWMISNRKIGRAVSKAASLQLWDVCDVLMERHQFDQSQYDLSFALLWAASEGHVGTAQKLLQHGAWVSLLWSGAPPDLASGCFDPVLLNLARGVHPLMEAACNGHAEMCSLILQHGRHKPTVREAIYNAVGKNHLAALNVLLQEGPDVSQPGLGSPPLFAAAYYGQLSMLEFFLGLGADPLNVPGSPWSGSAYCSYLVAAAKGGCTAVIELLLGRGVVLQPEWNVALKAAVSKGHLNVIRLLLTKAREAAGVQHQVQQPPQQTHHRLHNKCAVQQVPKLPDWASIGASLSIAAQHEGVAAALLLLHSGMEVTQEDLIIALATAASYGHLELMQLLHQHEADVDTARDSMFIEGVPLNNALNHRKWAAAEFLLLKGAHACHHTLVHALDNNAPTGIIQLLLQQGARDDGGFAMFWAAKKGQQEVVQVLMQAGRGHPHSQLQAALCGAASQARLDLVQSLLSSSDDVLSDPEGGLTGHTLKHILGTAVEAAMLGAKYDWELAEQGQFRNCTCFRITQSQKDTVSLLLQKGADPDYGAGWLLLVAVQQQDDALLQLLLDAGASVVEPALHIAAVYRSAAFIGKLLSTAKGPVDQDGAALAAAAKSCDVTVVRMLLDHGANVNAALQTVTANDNARAVMMLLSQSTARIADMDLLKVLLDMAPQQHSSGIWWRSRMAAWTVGQ